MNRFSFAALLGGAVLLGACQPEPRETASGARETSRESMVLPQQSSISATPAPATPLPTTASPVSGENDGYPDLTPAPLTGEAIRSEKGARSILLSWARAVEMREFDQAWAMMGDAARAQTSKARFNARLHPLRDITVAAPAGTMEGAAGSSYYTVPTIITGFNATGGMVTLKGDVVLRRVNDVDGATPEQLRWHIVQADLKPD